MVDSASQVDMAKGVCAVCVCLLDKVVYPVGFGERLLMRPVKVMSVIGLGGPIAWETRSSGRFLWLTAEGGNGVCEYLCYEA